MAATAVRSILRSSSLCSAASKIASKPISAPSSFHQPKPITAPRILRLRWSRGAIMGSRRRFPAGVQVWDVSMVSEPYADKLEEVGDDLGDGVYHSEIVRRLLDDACVDPRRGSNSRELGCDLGDGDRPSDSTAYPRDRAAIDPKNRSDPRELIRNGSGIGKNQLRERQFDRIVGRRSFLNYAVQPQSNRLNSKRECFLGIEMKQSQESRSRTRGKSVGHCLPKKQR